MNFFLFSHTLQILLLPPGINLLLFLIGMLIWRVWYFFSRILILLSFISLGLLSIPIVAFNLIEPLQNQYPFLTLKDLEKASAHAAIVILGGGDEKAPEYQNKPVLSDVTLSRLFYTVYLYNKLHIPVVVSGGTSLIDSSYTEASLIEDMLKTHFRIAPIWKENQSINTAEQSQFLLPLLIEHHIDHVYLVTNAWHMARTMYAFKSAFKNTPIKIAPAPMGYLLLDHQFTLINYLPSMKALTTSFLALHEYLGILWYFFFMR